MLIKDSAAEKKNEKMIALTGSWKRGLTCVMYVSLLAIAPGIFYRVLTWASHEENGTPRSRANANS